MTDIGRPTIRLFAIGAIFVGAIGGTVIGDNWRAIALTAIVVFGATLIALTILDGSAET